MKFCIATILITISSFTLTGQKLVEPIAPIDEPFVPISIEVKEPLQFAEKMPEFKGGIDSLMNYISKNLQYPEFEKENEIEGKVYVRFIVDTNGKVNSPTIMRSVSGSRTFDKEVIRLINDMPDWIPGQQNGQCVNVQFYLPIYFKLR